MLKDDLLSHKVRIFLRDLRKFRRSRSQIAVYQALYGGKAPSRGTPQQRRLNRLHAMQRARKVWRFRKLAKWPEAQTISGRFSSTAPVTWIHLPVTGDDHLATMIKRKLQRLP